MVDLFRKANAPYIIAGALATLTLISSLVLAVTSPVSFPLILALATLSVLVIVLSYKVIKNNRKIEDDRDKSAKKEQELENKITLEKEARKTVNRQVEELNNQLNKLMQEKQNLDKRARELDEKVVRLEAEKNNLSEEKKSLEYKLENKMNHVFEITKELEEIAKEKDELIKQTQELVSKISHLCEQLQKKEERITELKRAIDNSRLKNKELHKKKVEQPSKKKGTFPKIIRNIFRGNLLRKHRKKRSREELCKKQEEPNSVLGELRQEVTKLIKEKGNLSQQLKEKSEKLGESQCDFEEINKKNKDLSQDLSKVFKELDEANSLIENQSYELDEIMKDHTNLVTKLQNLLVQRDNTIKELKEFREGLKKVATNIQEVVECISCKGDRPIIASGDNSIKEILKNEIQAIKSSLEALKEIAMRHSPDPPPSSNLHAVETINSEIRNCKTR